jgi:hypothetical protein
MNYLELLPFLLLGLCDFDQEDCLYDKARPELDKLTRLLCEAGKVYLGEKPSKELLKWWKEHKESDEKRSKI